MKEYVYITMNCLVDKEGNPIQILVPKDGVEYTSMLAHKAYGEGMRMKEALNDSKNC